MYGENNLDINDVANVLTFLIIPVRISGPFVSSAIPICLLDSSAALRMFSMLSLWYYKLYTKYTHKFTKYK